MTTPSYIRIKIRKSTLDGDGRHRMVTVSRTEDTSTAEMGTAWSKYLNSVVMHALSWQDGVKVDEEDKFTYTFPFRLG